MKYILITLTIFFASRLSAQDLSQITPKGTVQACRTDTVTIHVFCDVGPVPRSLNEMVQACTRTCSDLTALPVPGEIKWNSGTHKIPLSFEGKNMMKKRHKLVFRYTIPINW